VLGDNLGLNSSLEISKSFFENYFVAFVKSAANELFEEDLPMLNI